MKLSRLLLLGGMAVSLTAPATFAQADPWRDGSGSRRYERHQERRWSERDRWERDRRGDRDRGRRAEYERGRAYEQGRRDARRDTITRDPVEALGLRGR